MEILKYFQEAEQEKKYLNCSLTSRRIELNENKMKFKNK